MGNKKSDNEGNISKVSAFPTPETKVVARTIKPKIRNKENPHSSAQSVGHKNGDERKETLPGFSGFASEEKEVRARIAKRAYELYEQRGWQHGNDVADWIQAAKEILVQKDVR